MCSHIILKAMIYATFAWNSRLTRESDIVNWFGSKGCMRCLICISMEQRKSRQPRVDLYRSVPTRSSATGDKPVRPWLLTLAHEGKKAINKLLRRGWPGLADFFLLPRPYRDRDGGRRIIRPIDSPDDRGLATETAATILRQEVIYKIPQIISQITG